MPHAQHIVLVVDDHLSVRNDLRALLEAEGYAVETAENGRAALSLLYTGAAPCVIVLDMMMPVMGGVEFRQEQLNHPRFADIPVIVLSATQESTISADLLRANAYLPKPVDITQLRALVQRYCPQ
jgi:CheY-like chemotaxis protein